MHRRSGNCEHDGYYDASVRIDCEDCVAHVLHCDECEFRIRRRWATPTIEYCDCTPKNRASDGVGYTRQEFRDHYGADGDRIWHESDGMRCGCDSPDEKRFAFDWIEYTELEFRERYGADGLRFWHETEDPEFYIYPCMHPYSTWCPETQQWYEPCFNDCEETRQCGCISCSH